MKYLPSLSKECDPETLLTQQLVHNDEENTIGNMSSNLERNVSCYLHNL